MSENTRPCVMIESPFAAKTLTEKQRKRKYAWEAVVDSEARGEAPFASHIFYTEILNDNEPTERQRGFDCHESWMAVCDYVVVYDDFGISQGMRWGIEMAFKLEKPVFCRKILK